jgi:shikimate kinase
MQSQSNVVISCGGGTPMRECNVVEMKKNGRVILLDAKPETIYERVKDSHDRPLLENNKNVPFIADLMGKRREKYEAAADIIIKTDGKTELEICEELIQNLLEMDSKEAK